MSSFGINFFVITQFKNSFGPGISSMMGGGFVLKYFSTVAVYLRAAAGSGLTFALVPLCPPGGAKWYMPAQSTAFRECAARPHRCVCVCAKVCVQSARADLACATFTSKSLEGGFIAAEERPLITFVILTSPSSPTIRSSISSIRMILVRQSIMSSRESPSTSVPRSRTRRSAFSAYAFFSGTVACRELPDPLGSSVLASAIASSTKTLSSLISDECSKPANTRPCQIHVHPQKRASPRVTPIERASPN